MTVFDRVHLQRFADGLAAALAFSLPWSTSATGILAGLWLIAVIPTFDLAMLRRVISTPAGGLPVMLCALAIIGLLWGFDIPIAERWDGLKSYYKLLIIPLLMVQFQRSERASWVMVGFLVSCVLLLILSWALVMDPTLFWPWSSRGGRIGVPIKDYIAQSTVFTVCVLLLASIAYRVWQKRRHGLALALSLLALAFLANVFFVSVSRTSLVVIPILVMLFACKQLSRQATVGLILAAAMTAVLAWSFSPQVRSNIMEVLSEVRNFEPEGERTRAGERLEFWKKSIGLIADAPLIGHGTGSIREKFRQTVTGKAGAAGLATSNPHNQTLAVAIQLGLVGTTVLFALWSAHILLFRGEGIAAWTGLGIVVQNIVGSLFNSHLFDFMQGWLYVLGVGIAGGVLLKSRAAPAPDTKAQSP